MDAQLDAISVAAAEEPDRHFEATFVAHYSRIARVVSRVIRDRARAEELAVDVFVRWWQHPKAHGDGAAGWLFRTATRMALDELRRNARRARFEWVLRSLHLNPRTPAEIGETSDEQRRVRSVLRTLSQRHASLLVLRSDGLSYIEIAAALELSPVSVGTFIHRAEHAFRTEYERRYGKHKPAV